MSWGVISPMDGMSPSDLQIESLVERVKGGEVKEVILALSFRRWRGHDEFLYLAPSWTAWT